ncbi:LysR family transcriptional regulator [Saccharopolyspora sp. 5N708]|uniref:LysR family transcriptional regulator n=1 Tax=Saccharopolyspora sp. 5N708 TaxID=3457424 RepID=UPI003FD3B567
MLRPDVRLEWFVSFLAVIDTGSFSTAAATTHRSQSRVSMHVASLERAVGLPLFDRRKRPVVPTEAGRSLADHAQTILRELDIAEAAMAARRGAARGVVTLGSFPSASAAFVPLVLEHFTRTSPDVKVILVERATLELDDALINGDVDVYLRPMAPPPVSSTVQCFPLWQEPLVVVHPPGHPLCLLDEPLSIEAVAAHPLITIGQRETSDLARFEPNRVFHERGLEIDLVQATNQPQTLISLVRHGLGVGVTNALAALVSDTRGVRVRRLESSFGRRVAVYWDSARPIAPAGWHLIEEIKRGPRPNGTEALPDVEEPEPKRFAYLDS